MLKVRRGEVTKWGGYDYSAEGVIKQDNLCLYQCYLIDYPE